MLDFPLRLPLGMLLLLLLLTTTTPVQAFSSATTLQRHHIIQAGPHRLKSGLHLFGRRNYRVENDKGGDSNDGNRSKTSNRRPPYKRGGVLRKEVKKLGAKKPRGNANRNEDRHAWKKKKKKKKKKKRYPGAGLGLPAVLKNAVYRWRGVTQKLRYAIYRNTVYVLECEGGKYYVGSTRNRARRYREHFESRRHGSKWTRLHKPVRVVAEYMRIPGRYLMGFESQKTSERMLEHGVNNVRGAGYCQVREFTTDDLPGLTTFLGHYNQLDYDELSCELQKVLPTPPRNSRTRNSNNKHRMLDSANDTKSTGNDADGEFTKDSYGRTFRNFKTKRRKKQRKRAKDKAKCYKCGKIGHFASDCSNDRTTTNDNDTSQSSSINNRWEIDDAAPRDNSMDATASVSSEISEFVVLFPPESFPSSKTSSSVAASIPSGVGIDPAAYDEYLSYLSEPYTPTVEWEDEKLPPHMYA